MFIRKVKIEGFRSYKSLETDDFEFSPDQNLIIGLNGHGKSNLLNCIQFVFNDQFQKLALDEKIRVAHEDGQGGTTKVSVELEIDNEKRFIPINQDTLLLKREFDTATGKDIYLLGNRIILKNDVYSMFGLSGIAFNEICRTIHQGKISEIANLEEDGILELLLDYSGATHLRERLDSLRSCLDLCDDKKDSIEKFKTTVEEKLDYIASKVSDFEKLNKLTTEKYSLEYMRLKKTGEELQGDLMENDNQRKTLIMDLNDVKLKKTNFLRVHEENTTKIKDYESRLHALRDKKKMLKDFVDMNEFAEAKALHDDHNMGYYKEEYERNFEDHGKSPAELQTSLETVLKTKDEYAAKVAKLTDQVSEVQQEYFNEKEQYDKLNDELNNISLKRTGFKSEKERKAYYEEEIDKIVTEITILERDVDIEIQSREKYANFEKDLIARINELKSDLDEKKREESKIKEELDPSKNRQDNLSQIQKMNFGLNEKKIERNENLRKIERIEEIIESADKKYKTIKRLVKKIEEADVAGYHGLFIDLIEINERIEFSVDIALKNKMFVFVVDTVSAAQKIMKLNTEIKGGAISVFPLELIEQISDSIPSIPPSNEIKPILDFVTLRENVDERVGRLLKNFLGKTVIVRNLSTAFGVSERYQVTSITADMKIVNPGAYIAKTGYCDVMKKRIEPYRGLLELKKKDRNLKQGIFELETNIQNYQNTDLRLLKDMQEYLISHRQITQSIQNYTLELMDRTTKLADCQRNIERSSNNIINISKQVDVLKNSRDSLLKDLKSGKKSEGGDSKDSSKLIQELEAKKNRVISLRMKLNSIQKELDEDKSHLFNNILQREEQLKESIASKGTDKPMHNSKRKSRKSMGLKNMIGYDQEMIREKEQELERIIEVIRDKEMELEELQKGEVASATDRAQVDDQIIDKVVQLERLNVDRRNLHDKMGLDKLEDLKAKYDADFAVDKDYSIAKLNELIKKKEEQIKVIEKSGNQSHMYGFFLRMKEQFEDVKKKVEKLTEVKLKIFDILTESESSKNVAIQNSLKKLAKKFNEYFAYFVKDAETSIKFIRTELESKEENKEEVIKEGDDPELAQTVKSEPKGFKVGDHQYTGISVRVGFKDKNRMQSLKELSGGEKTVVALSLLLALNSLTSSQIYLLDEVDSALDQVYRAGMTELLAKISASRSTQFFITTFHQELIDSIEHIYKVEFRNLQSKIAPCTKNRAVELLKKMSEDQNEEKGE